MDRGGPPHDGTGPDGEDSLAELAAAAPTDARQRAIRKLVENFRTRAITWPDGSVFKFPLRGKAELRHLHRYFEFPDIVHWRGRSDDHANGASQRRPGSASGGGLGSRQAPG